MKEKDNIAEYFKENLNSFEADTKGLDWAQMQSTINSASTVSSIGSKFSIISSSITTNVITVVIASTILATAYFANDYFGNAKDSNKESNDQSIIESKMESMLKEDSTSVSLKSNANQIEEKTESSIGAEIEKSTSKEIEKVRITAKDQSQKTSKEEELQNQTSMTSDEIKNQLSEEELEQIIQENEQQFASKDDSDQNVDSNTEINKEEGTNTNTANSLNKAEDQVIKHEEVKVMIPNVFTPNHDGVNDVFVIEDDGIEKLEVKIIDKTGNLIHEWNTLYGFWDGNLPNGEIAPQGVYFYQISGTKNQKAFTKQGIVNLKR